MPDPLRNGPALRLAASLAIVVGMVAATCAAEPPAPDAEAVRVRAFVMEPLEFRPSVFDGKAFPPCEFGRPAEVEKLVGPYAIETSFFDRDNRPVDAPGDPGPYSAVIRVIPERGRAHRRVRTLYRLPSAIEPGRNFDRDDPKGAAEALGLDPGAVARQSKLVFDTFRKRAFVELAADPTVARLLAGLAATTPGDGPPVPRQLDAFVVDRQRIVDLKRKLDGLDKAFPDPVVAPTPFEGKPATVVREGTAEEAGFRPDAAEKIDAACRAFEAETDEAFTICVVRHGVIVIHKAYGTRGDGPMTVDTKSWMASVTKAMSATTMMMLIDRGIVGLDDPIDESLPELRGISVETPLTIRHLYTHTNGLDKWDWNPYLPDLEDRVADVYPILKVGREWAYNGVGYELGGKVIEAVSGEAVPSFFQHHLLGPLGCTGTEVSGTHADAFSVPLDMAKFGQLLLNEGSYGNLRFFRAESFRRMLPEKLTALLGPETTKTFGFGLDGGPKQFGHGSASAATFHINVEDDLVVVMTRNKMGKNQDRYNGVIWDAIKGGIVRSAPVDAK